MPARPKKEKSSKKVFVDPRRRRGFLPKFFPRCDSGPPPPPGATDVVARRQIEFLSAYYDLNVLYAKLEGVRLKSGNAQTLLRRIAAALRARDELEDRYAPEGFFGEPEMDGVFFRNLTFSHALAAAPAPPVESSFSLFVPLVLPEGLTLRQYVARELGLAGPPARTPKKARGSREKTR